MKIRRTVAFILVLSIFVTSMPLLSVNANSLGELVYQDQEIQILMYTSPDGAVTFEQYVSGEMTESVTCTPGDPDSVLVTRNNEGELCSEQLENPFVDVQTSPRPYGVWITRLGVITYRYSTDTSAGTCRAEVSYSYDATPSRTVFKFRPVAYQVYSIASIVALLISAAPVLSAVIAGTLARELATLYGFAVGAAGFYFTDAYIPLSADLTEYTFSLVNVDNPTHRNTITTKYYKITEDEDDRYITECWEGHIPTECWRTYSFGVAVMGALWQYDYFTIESWTYQ